MTRPLCHRTFNEAVRQSRTARENTQHATPRVPREEFEEAGRSQRGPYHGTNAEKGERPVTLRLAIRDRADPLRIDAVAPPAPRQQRLASSNFLSVFFVQDAEKRSVGASNDIPQSAVVPVVRIVPVLTVNHCKEAQPFERNTVS